MAESRGKEQQGESGRGSRAMQRASGGGGGLAPWSGNPFSMMDWMLDRMQRDFFGAPLLSFPRWGESGAEQGLERLARMDVRDTDKELRLTFELPGIDPKDAKIECREDMLIVRAESRHEEKEKGEQEGMESYTTFYRQLMLPADVDPEKAEASFKHGLLTIRFPKRPEQRRVRQIPISAESREEKAA